MKISAFTKASKEITLTLETDCVICDGFDPVKEHRPQSWQVIAQWDTGAKCSVISNSLAEDMGLAAVGTASLTGVTGTAEVNLYEINVILPNNVEFQFRQVCSCDLEGVDFLIGMDVISLGDFTVTHPQGNTKLTFQMPPTHDTDYLQELNDKQAAASRLMSSIDIPAHGSFS